MSATEDMALAEVAEYRLSLWRACPHPLKYGDDGQLQCSGMNFLTARPEAIVAHVTGALIEPLAAIDVLWQECVWQGWSTPTYVSQMHAIAHEALGSRGFRHTPSIMPEHLREALARALGGLDVTPGEIADSIRALLRDV